MTNEQLVELLQMGIDMEENMGTLYLQNKPILTKICRPYAQVEPLEDLLQQSYFGLLEAVRRYDASAGCKFVTFAWYWIEQAVREYIVSSGRLIRLPAHMDNLIFRYKRFVSSYESDHAGLLPSDEEIRNELNISEKQLDELKKYVLCSNVKSLDVPIDESDGRNTLQDYIASPYNMEENVIDAMYHQELREAMQAAMSIALTEEEHDTMTAYYWNNETLGSIAARRGVTKGWVRQQILQAQSKLTRGRARRILKEFVKVEGIRYSGGFSFFKQHGSIVEYEIMRKDDILTGMKSHLPPQKVI